MRSVADEFKEKKNLQTAKLIYLYSIKYDETGNQYLRYTNYGKPITFQGYEYTPYVITHDSIQEDLSGGAIKVNMRIANVNRYIQAINERYSLNEKEVKIIAICEEEITDSQAYTEDTFRVVDMAVNKSEAVFQLSSPFDVMDIRVPKRYFFRAYCRFRFGDGNCQYSGSASDCNKSLQRCRELSNTIHFGAFPSIPIQRMYVE